MKTATQMTKVKMVISRGLATQHPVKLVGILALGTLLLAGTAVQLAPESHHEEGSNPTSVSSVTESEDISPDAWRYDPPYYDDFRTGEASSPSYHQQRTEDSIPEWPEAQQVLEGTQNSGESGSRDSRVGSAVIEDLTELFGEDVVATLGYEVLIARLNDYKADGRLSSRDLERLDQEIGVLLMAAADTSSKVNAISHQEVKRLEHKIDELLQAAEDNPSASPRLIDREVQRLDHQIDVLLINAAHHPLCARSLNIQC